MTWRTAAVFASLVVATTFGATLAGGLVVPFHAEHLGNDTPVGSTAGQTDLDALLAATTADLPGFVSADSTGVESRSESAVATLPTAEYRRVRDTAEVAIQSVLDAQMPYPAEEEPDGNRWLPHHGLWALGLYLVGWYYWHAGGVPVFGATLVGLAVLLLLDDWLSHALGIQTPGDTAFKWLMRRRSFRRMYIRLWWIIYR